MKRSTSDIVLMVFKIILLAAITFYLAYSLISMVTALPLEDWEGLGFVVLFIVGLFVNGAAFFLSLILLILSCVFKGLFTKKAEKEAEGYEKCLKIKKHNILHFALLMVYAVAAALLILFAASFLTSI